MSLLFSDRNGIHDVKYMGQHTTLTEGLKNYPEINFAALTPMAMARNTWERLASYYIQRTSNPYWAGRSYVDIFDAYTYFDLRNALSTDGTIPHNMIWLDFHNMQDSVNEFWKTHFHCEVTMPLFERNLKDNAETARYQAVLNDKEFIEYVRAECAFEIELFGYEPP